MPKMWEINMPKGIYTRKEENIRKMREKLKGRKLTEEHKRHIKENHIGMLGKRHSIKSKKKMGRYGEDNHNWEGGKTSLRGQIYNSYKFRQWRSDVFTRDNFTCQDCNIRNGNLEAHHIKGFMKMIQENNIKTLEEALNCEELWNINNGLTLCQKCHKKTKNYSGNGIKRLSYKRRIK